MARARAHQGALRSEGKGDSDAAPAEGEASGDLEDVVAEALPGPEPLVAAADQGASGMKEVGGVEGQEPAGLVRSKGIAGDARRADPPPTVVLFGPWRRGEPDLKNAVQLAEIALGIAPPPVALQELEAVHLLAWRVGQEEEVVEEELGLLTGPCARFRPGR